MGDLANPSSSSSFCSVVSDSLRPHGLQPARLLCPWDSPGKNTGVGCHFLLQLIPLSGQKWASPPGSTSSSLTTHRLISEVMVGEEGQRPFPQAPGGTCGRWCHPLGACHASPMPSMASCFGAEYKIMVSSQAPECPCARKQTVDLSPAPQTLLTCIPKAPPSVHPGSL